MRRLNRATPERKREAELQEEGEGEGEGEGGGEEGKEGGVHHFTGLVSPQLPPLLLCP